MNYNGPKVGIPSSRHEGAAPLMGDHETRSRLYAGNSEYPVVLASREAVKIHPVRTISRKDSAKSNDLVENPQRPYADPLQAQREEDEMVRSLRRRREVDGDVSPPPRK